MKKMNKKGIAPLIWVGIVIASLVAAVFFTPVGEVLGIGTEKYCGDAPYSNKCYCFEDEERLTIDLTVDRYLCENTNKMFNPESTDFDEQAKSYAVQKFQEQFPLCDMNTCARDGTSFEVVWGYQNYERRVAQVECMSDNGYRFSSISFDIVEGTVQEAYCGNYADVVSDVVGQAPAPISLGDIRGSELAKSFSTFGTISSSCRDDNGVGVTSFIVPSTHISEWGFVPYASTSILGNTQNTITLDLGVTCTVTDSTSSYATIKCDAGCPHPDFSGMRFTFAGVVDASYWESIPKCVENGKAYAVDSKVVCGRYQYSCQGNDHWLRLADGYATTAPVCPTSYDAMCAITVYGTSTWYMPGDTNPNDGTTCQNNGVWA